MVNEGDPEAVGVTVVSVTDIICGDVTNDLTISALDASYILRHSVRMSPQFPLVGGDSQQQTLQQMVLFLPLMQL